MKRTVAVLMLFAVCTMMLVASSSAYEIDHNKDYKKSYRNIEQLKNKAGTEEKREAIESIHKIFKKYRRHLAVMDCVEMIVKTDRNVDIIKNLAAFGIREGSATQNYIELAEYAMNAPLADTEFIEIADLIKLSGSGDPMRFAKRAAQANTEKELNIVRADIANFDLSTANIIKDPYLKIEKLREKADSVEKREAIDHITDLFKEYRRHLDVMDCVDMIVKTDRNVDVIKELASLGIIEGSRTGDYIKMAGYAMKAPVADDEFLDLAMILQRTGNMTPVRLAEEASEAQSEEELKPIKKKIEKLMRN